MRANELRIGNIVNYFDGQITDINFISWEDIKVIDVGLGANFKPIPLTEEWFMKLGLTSDSYKQYSTSLLKAVTFASFAKQNEGWILYSGHNCLYVKLKYVHQLQNIYFALTGYELIITK